MPERQYRLLSNVWWNVLRLEIVNLECNRDWNIKGAIETTIYRIIQTKFELLSPTLSVRQTSGDEYLSANIGLKSNESLALVDQIFNCELRV